MKHVDALSLNIQNLNLLAISSEDWFLSIQLLDDTLRIIVDKLKQADCDQQIKNTYAIKDNRLYIKTADGNNKLVIPNSARFNIFRKYHDDIGHIGLRKCGTLIKTTVPVQQLREDKGGILSDTESDSQLDSTDELLDLLECWRGSVSIKTNVFLSS
nr:unnamed protein product [Callosobruchus analis]